MRFKYSTTSPAQNEFDSLPRLSLSLHREDRIVESIGLLDSGATVNVLPYELGLQLGGVWEDRKAIIQLAGNLGNQPAMPFSAIAQIGEFLPTELVFAWSRSSNVPLILGQTNFFLEFDVCFYRSTSEFEVKPKSQTAKLTNPLHADRIECLRRSKALLAAGERERSSRFDNSSRSNWLCSIDDRHYLLLLKEQEK